MDKLKAYEVASSNTSSNLSSINTVNKVNALVLKQANKHAFAICELRNTATEERQKANKDMATLKLMIFNMAEQKLYKKKKAKKTRFVKPESESQSESEIEDETPLPPTPPRKKGKRSKSKKAKSLSKTTSKRASKFILGCDFKPPMKWDNSWDTATKMEYTYKRREYGQAHPDWRMDENETYFRQ